MTYYEHTLPHWHPDGKTIFLTWRLFGSLPMEFLKSLTKLHKQPGKQFAVADRELDAAASGPLWLREPEIATCVHETILRGASLGQYKLLAHVVMPNHVHLLIEPSVSVARITRGVKGVSAREANILLNRVGKHFWQPESFDHWIRNGAALERTIFYIENNPVKARLVRRAEDWKWSSAHR